MPGHDIIVIGASAGGVKALIQLVGEIPKDLPAAIFIVVHVSPYSTSYIPNILRRNGPLPAAHATEGQVIVPGHIYVAPPDHHLLVKRGYVRVVQGPKENGTRPAVDPLFRTAAKTYQRRVVGLILSGTLDDGTAGLMDVKRFGGVAVVQDPNDALFSGMPTNAIDNVEVDYILPVSSIASVLARLAHEPVVEQGAKTVSNDNEIEQEPDVVELDGAALRDRGHPGKPSGFICPDCGGGLYQLQERDFLQFRCRVGHAWSAESLLAGQSKAQEEALWEAVRSLEERGELMNRMATNAKKRQNNISAKRFEDQALNAQQRADLIRRTLVQTQLPTAHNSAESEPNSPPDSFNSPPFKVVVLAASTGGLNVLSQILPTLPPTIPAAIIVVQHLDTQSPSELLGDFVHHSNMLPLKYAQAGEALKPGLVYIASPSAHLLVNPDGTLSSSQAVFVNFSPPSIDLLLESVAASFKERAIAVILTGTGKDGSLGVQAIHKMGGKVIAQDEDSSEFFEMPSAAIQTGIVDFVVPMSAIASTILNLVEADSLD